jgi:hypothetical protein
MDSKDDKSLEELMVDKKSSEMVKKLHIVLRIRK